MIHTHVKNVLSITKKKKTEAILSQNIKCHDLEPMYE